MGSPTREQMIEIIDELAREWDGCEYDEPGGAIDIGDAIRTAGFRRVHALFDSPAPSPATTRDQQEKQR